MISDLLFILGLAGASYLLVHIGERAARTLRLLRKNRTGEVIPTGAAFPVVILQALLLTISHDAASRLMGAAGVLLACTGLYDDWCSSRARRHREVKGWRGHLAALVRGRPTSGSVKILGGAAVLGLVFLFVDVAGPGPPGFLRDGALIALAANLINGLDVVPGRAGKGLLVGLSVLIVAGPGMGPTAFVLLVPPMVFLARDLSRRSMMGDAGANGWGGILGALAVVVLSPLGRWLVLSALVVLQVLSDTVTFSRIIEGCAGLSYLDRLGR